MAAPPRFAAFAQPQARYHGSRPPRRPARRRRLGVVVMVQEEVPENIAILLTAPLENPHGADTAGGASIMPTATGYRPAEPISAPLLRKGS